MDQIKEAFAKVKSEIETLKSNQNSLDNELSQIQLSILNLTKNITLLTENQQLLTQTLEALQKLQSDRQTDTSTDRQTPSSTEKQTQNSQNPAIRQVNSTDNQNSTDNLPFKSLKHPNMQNSTRNEGVSTDRQTDRQTDTSTGNEGVLQVKSSYNLETSTTPSTHSSTDNSEDPAFLLSKLGKIQRQLRYKVKSLTNQEMLVLSSIYQFENDGELVDYTLLSSRLGLSQSSVRDYAQRIINKGINLSKNKVNNKRVLLSISEDFRRLASLNTLISLRDL